MKHLETDQNSNGLGEFAIATNIFLRQFVGNLLQDEKFPSVHVAFGDPYRDETGAVWSSRTHIDASMKNATLRVDGTTLMKNGRFLF